jgi:regulator of sigma E protease
MIILKFIFILLEVLVLFNLLIFVHELGHFLAARWRGLKIERFAVWFGKPIWKKEINGVVYCLGSIPAGGYVALPQMASMEAIEGKTDAKAEELPRIGVLDKIIVAFAGPLFSFGLAFVFAILVWFIGRPISETETTTIIGFVMKGSPAEAAGLMPGDEIVQVDGHPVTRFGGIGDSVSWRVVSSVGETIPVTVKRSGKELCLLAKPTREKTEAWERKSLREIQIMPFQTAMIAKVVENSPAALAKLRPNDVILQVNGTKVFNPAAVGEFIKSNPGLPVTLKVERAAKTFEVTLTPVLPEDTVEKARNAKEEKIARLGIEWEQGGKMNVDHPDPVTQIKASVTAMVNTFSAILSRKSDIKLQHLSGPVGIVRIYYRLFESEQGWRLAIWFSVILNVNLGLLNLLPIPVLDGGHITLSIVEGIRRRPVNLRIMNIVQTSCAVLIIGYMLYVTFYDAQDWGGKRQKQTEMKFAPPAPPSTPK